MAVNAKAVIDIDLNDQAFKAFQQKFEQFQRVVSRNAAFKQMGQGAKDMMVSFTKMAEAMGKTQEQLRKAVIHARDVATHSAHTERLWHKVGHHAKHFAHWVGHATMHILKWVGITGMISGAITSLTTLFGLTSMAAGARRDRREAAGLRLSYGEQKALEHAFGHQLNVSGIQQGVATAQADRQSEEYRAMRRMGINPRGMSAADANRAVYDKMWQIAQGGGNFGEIIRRRKLGALGIDVNQLNALQGMTREEFDRRRATANDPKAFNVSDKALSNWTKFIDYLDKAGDKIKSILLEQLGERMMPVLTEITEKLTKWLEKFFKSGGFEELVDTVTQAFERLAHYLTSPEGLSYHVDLAAQMFKKLVKVLKWATDPFDDEGNKKAVESKEKEIAKAAEESKFRQWLERNMPWLMGSVPEATQTGPNRDTSDDAERIRAEQAPNKRGRHGRSRTGTTASQRMGFGTTRGGGGGGGGFTGDWTEDIKQLMGFGWTKDQAVGIVANLNDESAGKINAVGDGGLAYGLAQWHPDRQAQFKRVFGKDIRQATRAEQIAFINWELNNSEKSAGDRLRATRDHRSAASVFSRFYERPAAADEAAANRANTADRIAVKHGHVTIVAKVENSTGADVTLATSGATGR